MSRTRELLIGLIADYLIAQSVGHPLRVAVDGVTAAGKSTFAAELEVAIAARNTPAIHLSTDDYHHSQDYRRRNPDRALGYYRDAYDLAAFRAAVLDPPGQQGDRRYRPKLHDLTTDELVDAPLETAPRRAVVIVDGSFLQSDALAGGWDEVIYLDTSYAVAMERALFRDAGLFGGPEGARAAYATRYHAACDLYIAERSPKETATIVVDNNDLENPTIIRGAVIA